MSITIRGMGLVVALWKLSRVYLLVTLLLANLPEPSVCAETYRLDYEVLPDSALVRMESPTGCFSGDPITTTVHVGGTFTLEFRQEVGGVAGRFRNIDLTGIDQPDFHATGSGNYVDAGPGGSYADFHLEINGSPWDFSEFADFASDTNRAKFPSLNVGGRASSSRVCFFLRIVAEVSPEDLVRFFVRGDVDGNGVKDITDAITTLSYLFLGGEKPSCLDAADTDDNGKVDVTDAVLLLEYLFLGGARPEVPTLLCGIDPTDDTLECAGQAGCMAGP